MYMNTICYTLWHKEAYIKLLSLMTFAHIAMYTYMYVYTGLIFFFLLCLTVV